MSGIKVFRSVKDVREYRLQCTLRGESVGFVPTMGALHEGHCSLIKESLNNNDVTIVSIFVNPSQFSPTEDLDAYPRTLDCDLELLSVLKNDRDEEENSSRKVNAVFVPTVSEMYPSGISLDVNEQKGAFVSVLGVSGQLEGRMRPQFFRGVATVVTKLFNVITPTKAYFGQKDIQQTVVVKNLVKDLLLPIEIVVLPTIREKSGLALSSRNSYLSENARDDAAIIYKALHLAELEYYNNNEVTDSLELLKIIDNVLKDYTDGTKGNYDIDYVSINHPKTLDTLDKITPGVGAIISTAIKVPNGHGDFTRLIDNVVLK
ncbi:hypothetical protein PACTADRAFT_50265 [Pachysolen tannophilus NRRL Y-2460]|uniref:Pantoate--beta-alanine ligase n=1 Tax=Pachysolen tannophilus NRRL Y-2460 TaxID=669874 RepID=A0A1E4TV04_PACTA|nr:hypothetical protein PACTADRAFT_50265 [Pachysolen tannophilus NRRL Y-2460]